MLYFAAHVQSCCHIQSFQLCQIISSFCLNLAGCCLIIEGVLTDTVPTVYFRFMNDVDHVAGDKLQLEIESKENLI